MSERQEFEAGKEARHGVLHGTRHEGASADPMEALVRYLNGAGQGRSTGAGRAKPLSDTEIRSHAVDLVVDAGGEVSAAIVAAGSLWLRARVERHSQAAVLERKLSEIPGVTRVDLRLAYGTDDLPEEAGAARVAEATPDV
jgi:hypothetical protein